ncbi:MAG TPA: hypothetical protein VGR53_06500 [Nitrososphaerales archaeon]|nr:hypothetical protein [Nitrososphaerales archaeon]
MALCLILALLASGLPGQVSLLSLSLMSSVLFLESHRDFEAVAAGFSKQGAQAPAFIMGKSGVKHEFAFAIIPSSNKAKIVVDTELSVKEVDEMKVLKFYVKVFDVSPEKAILCVSPKLSERARALAKEYGITVLEDEVPRKLIGMASEAVEKAMVGA